MFLPSLRQPSLRAKERYTHLAPLGSWPLWLDSCLILAVLYPGSDRSAYADGDGILGVGSGSAHLAQQLDRGSHQLEGAWRDSCCTCAFRVLILVSTSRLRRAPVAALSRGPMRLECVQRSEGWLPPCRRLYSSVTSRLRRALVAALSRGPLRLECAAVASADALRGTSC